MMPRPLPAARAARCRAWPAVAALLAGCGASQPAPPSGVAAAQAASSEASPPPPCASLPAHDPRCVAGIGATMLGVCVWSMHAVTCWGKGFEEAGRPLVEFPVDPWALVAQADASPNPGPTLAEARRALDNAPLPPRALAAAERSLPRSEVRQQRCSLSTAGEVLCDPSLADPDSRGLSWRFIDLDATAALASTDRFACALSVQGVTRCWGSAVGFPVGYGFPFARAKVLDLAWAEGGVCIRVDGGEVACARRQAGRLLSPVRLDLRAPVEQLVWASKAGFCGRSRGRVSCWSFGEQAQWVEGLLDAEALEPGVPCARRPGGSLVCWQRATTAPGEGEGPLTAYDPGVGKASMVFRWGTDSEGYCAVTERRELRCWGEVALVWGRRGEAVPWTSSKAIAVPGGSGIREASRRGCFVRDDGRLARLSWRNRTDPALAWAGGRWALSVESPPGAPVVVGLVSGDACEARLADGRFLWLERGDGAQPPKAYLGDVPQEGIEPQPCSIGADGLLRCEPAFSPAPLSQGSVSPLVVTGG